MTRQLLALSIAVLLLGSATAVAEPSPTAKQEAQKFVQGFYDWYLNQKTPFEMAVKEKKSDFDPTLLKLLKEDLEASAKSPGEIVGLDFEPFLNTQDPGEKYVVGNAASQGETSFRVEIFRINAGKKGNRGRSTRHQLTLDARFRRLVNVVNNVPHFNVPFYSSKRSTYEEESKPRQKHHDMKTPQRPDVIEAGSLEILRVIENAHLIPDPITCDQAALSITDRLSVTGRKLNLGMGTSGV